MKLYSFWRSTTSFRVRVVLNLLDVCYEIRPVDLATGAQFGQDYTALNPGQGVPSLELPTGEILTQSMAIIDYLLATHDGHTLVPDTPISATRMRAAVDTIAMDIHPVNNLRVLARLRELGHDPQELTDWMCHWMAKGLIAYQALIRPDTSFSFADHPTLADVCLAGQMINARRWGLDLAPLTRLVEIDARCAEISAFADALPENQRDAQQG